MKIAANSEGIFKKNLRKSTSNNRTFRDNFKQMLKVEKVLR